MMRATRRAIETAIAVGLAAALAGCATGMTAGAYRERGVDFSRYRTFAWEPADALPTGDPRLDANPYFNDRFMGAVERGLAARGFALVDAGSPDLRIHYHASVSRRPDGNRLDAEYGNCVGDDCPTGVVEYEAGTLVLDIIDARNDRLVWRGWARDSIEDVLGDRDRLERMIDDAVARMLQHLSRDL